MEKLSQALTSFFNVFVVMGIPVPETFKPFYIVFLKIGRLIFLTIVTLVLLTMIYTPLRFSRLYMTDLLARYWYTNTYLIASVFIITQLWLSKNHDKLITLYRDFDQFTFPESALQNIKSKCWKLLFSVTLMPFVSSLPYFGAIIIQNCLHEFNISSCISATYDIFSLVILFFPYLVSFSVFLPGEIILYLVVIFNDITREKFEYWGNEIYLATSSTKKLKLLKNMCIDVMTFQELFSKIDSIFSFVLTLKCIIVLHGVPFVVAFSIASSSWQYITVTYLNLTSPFFVLWIVIVILKTSIQLNHLVRY